MLNTIKYIFTKLFICFLLTFSLLSSAQNNTLQDKKRQLDQLQVKIKALEKNLKLATNKNALLEKELVKTSSQINEYNAKIKQIQNNLEAKETEIATLQTQIQEITAKLNIAQKQIARYIVEQYKTHDTTKIKILLTQKNVEKTEKILTYYKYLLAANKKLIYQFKLNSEALNDKNQQLQKELLKLQNIKENLYVFLNKLQENKKYKSTLIKQLSLNINKDNQTLRDYRQNQNNLSKLINNLTKQSVLQTKNSVMQMQGKLPKPINVDPSQIKRMHQGLVFYAPEGKIVHAVSIGKVVFADWLNGYGLLIILDHGWGVMSLYANNLQLLKHTGETVISGEKIAKIGHSGVLQENGLYFEIRHHGKAMPPEKWLHQ